MIEELLDYYSELFEDTIFSIGSALNMISHGMAATTKKNHTADY